MRNSGREGRYISASMNLYRWYRFLDGVYVGGAAHDKVYPEFQSWAAKKRYSIPVRVTKRQYGDFKSEELTSIILIQVPTSSECEIKESEWAAKAEIRNFPGSILVKPNPNIWGAPLYRNESLYVLGQGSLTNIKQCTDLKPNEENKGKVFQCDFKNFAIEALLRVGRFSILYFS